MIAAIYARKSTDDSDRNEEARSTARQIERAREYARAKGWTVLDEHVYIDDGISGAEFLKRPGLTKLLAALKVQPPPFQVLIVSEQSRLGRDTLRTLQVIQEVEEAGVKLYSYLDDREVSVGDEMGEVEQFIKSWASAAERRKASQRTRDAVKLRAERGQVPGGGSSATET